MTIYSGIRYAGWANSLCSIMRVLFCVMAWLLPFGLSYAAALETRNIMSGLSDAGWQEALKIVDPDGAPGHQLGYAVAIDGDTLLVGAIGDGGSGTGGAVHVYVRRAGVWAEQAILTPSDLAFGDYFGASITISGDTALIGAPHKGTFEGAVYVFSRAGDTWSEEAKLTASDSALFQVFGQSIALSENVAMIGAPGVTSSQVGSVYIFDLNDGEWEESQKITSLDGAGGDRFGHSIDILDNKALIGAPHAEIDGNIGTGAAYVFTFGEDQWSEATKLSAVDGVAGDYFGGSVSLSGEYALVGAPARITGQVAGSQEGAVYVFRPDEDGWMEIQKLVASDMSEGDAWEFGYSISSTDTTILASAVFANSPGGVDHGAVYEFHNDGSGWVERSKIAASDGSPGDQFGYHLAFSGTTAVIGVPKQPTDLGANQGAAYVFESFEPEDSIFSDRFGQ